MAEYKSNSHKSKELATANSNEREKRFDKVVSGSVKTKKNHGRKLADIFIAEDINTVKEHLFMDVFVPTAKKFISEIARDAVDMLLYGRVQGNKGGAANKISYSKYYGGSSNSNDRFAGGTSSNTNSRFNYDDLVFDSRGAAETVLTRMREAVQEYRLISVADMYDMAGLTAPWTSARYGWTATALEHAEVVRNPDGYVIKLPKASPFD